MLMLSIEKEKLRLKEKMNKNAEKQKLLEEKLDEKLDCLIYILKEPTGEIPTS
jgi:hypothetical protein